MRYYGADVFDLHVAVLMQDTVITCEKRHTVAHAMELMHSHHIRHLPVTDKGKLIGLLSLRDVLPRMFQDYDWNPRCADISATASSRGVL